MLDRKRLLAGLFGCCVVTAILLLLGDWLPAPLWLARLGAGDRDPVRRALWSRLPGLFAAGDYDGIERLVATYRAERTRCADGSYLLEDFYGAVDKVRSDAGGWEGADVEKVAAFEPFAAWERAKPRSTARMVAMVEAHVRLAWDARGNGWGNQVTASGSRGFRAHLREAWRLIEEAQALEEQDPQLYAVAMTVCMGLHKSGPEVDRLIMRGRALDPAYQPLYRCRATALLPRWGGGEGDVEAFVLWAADGLGGDDGDELYARLAESVQAYVGAPAFAAEHRFDHERMRRGYDVVARRYPAQQD